MKKLNISKNITILGSALALLFLGINLSACTDCCDDVAQEENLLVGTWWPEYGEDKYYINGVLRDTEIFDLSDMNRVQFNSDETLKVFDKSEDDDGSYILYCTGTYSLQDKTLKISYQLVDGDSIYVEFYNIEVLSSTRFEFSSYRKEIQENGDVYESTGYNKYYKVN